MHSQRINSDNENKFGMIGSQLNINQMQQVFSVKEQKLKHHSFIIDKNNVQSTHMEISVKQKQKQQSVQFCESGHHLEIQKNQQIAKIDINNLQIGSTKKRQHQNTMRSPSNLYNQDKSLHEKLKFKKKQTKIVKSINNIQRVVNKINLQQQLQIYRLKSKTQSNLIFQYEIGIHIYREVIRNKTIQCNYTLFHILFLLNNLQVKSRYTNLQPSQMQSYNKQCIKKLMLPNMKAQITQQSLYRLLAFIVRARNFEHSDILTFMRQFVTEYQQILIGICPYYYNLFALNINKSIVFEQTQPKIDELIDYSVEYRHRKFYGGKFGRQDVFQVIGELQFKIRQKYNSHEM